MDEQNNILILRYLNGELSIEEKTSFEARLLQDEELKATLLEFQQIVHVVKDKERKQIKAEIAYIGSEIHPKDLENYAPKYPPPSNTSIWIDTIKSILFFLFVILVACLLLIYFNQFPLENAAVKKIHDKMMLLKENSLENQDTIFRTIENENVTKDTLVYGEEEAIEYYETIGTEIIMEEKLSDSLVILEENKSLQADTVIGEIDVIDTYVEDGNDYIRYSVKLDTQIIIKEDIEGGEYN